MNTQSYNGQILGTYDGEPLLVKVDENGQLLTSQNFTSNAVVLPLSSRTVSGESIEFDTSKYKEAVVFLDVTNVSGTTPTLDVKFQTQDPVSLKWFDVSGLVFSQKNAIGIDMKEKVNALGNKIRCVYDIGGTTPSFTFSVGLVLKS